MTSDTYIDSSLPSDEELQELTDYVGGFMSEAEERAYDARLAGDDAFFDRISPTLKIWYSLPPSVIEAGEQLKVRLAPQRSRGLAVRGPVSAWVRRHPIALGGYAAAASLIVGALLQFPLDQEVSLVAKAPAAKSDSGAESAPRIPETIAAASVTSKRPSATKRAKAPAVDNQVPVVPTEPVEESPSLPALPDVAITPQARVSAAADTIFVSASEWAAGPLNLGSDRNLVTPPTRRANATDKGVPNQPGTGWQLPLWLRPWDWQWPRGG